MEQVEVNVKELKKAAEAISKHDTALRNVREEIQEVEAQLGQVVEVQQEFAEGVRDVTRVQTKMVNAQDSLEKKLDRSADLVDEKIEPLLKGLRESVEDFRSTADRFENASQDAKESAEDFAEEMEEEANEVWKEVLDGVEQKVREGFSSIIDRAEEEVDQMVEDKVNEAEERIRRSVEAIVEGQKDRIDKKIERVERVGKSIEENSEEIRGALEKLETAISSIPEEEARDADQEGTMSRLGKLFGN